MCIGVCPCVQYILVVVTPVQVFLLAVTFADDDISKPLTLVPTGISCSTDSVGIVHVVRPQCASACAFRHQHPTSRPPTVLSGSKEGEGLHACVRRRVMFSSPV